MVVRKSVTTIEGHRVRLSRLRTASVALLLLMFLAACGSGNTDVSAGVLGGITVSGTVKAPTLTFKTKPLSVKATTTKVVTAGKGAKLSKANSIVFNYVLFNAKNGKEIETSFGKSEERRVGKECRSRWSPY